MRNTLSLLLAAAITCVSLSAIATDSLDETPPYALPESALSPAAPESVDGDATAFPSTQAPAAAEQPPVPILTNLPAAPVDLWQRIRNGFGLPELATPLVREQEEWFAKRPDYLKRTVARSSRYLYHIVEAIEKRGMPSEIALLPIIESAYNPTAYSRAHASGIWQFIPETGKRYGLQQNFWYDGRRDVMAATTAALDYLEMLYNMFGSWDLALAAYNWGENAVARAIAKNVAKGLPTDYLNLSMPLETRYYIPKLQAVKNIVADPARYGIDLAEVPNQPYFVAVTNTRNIDVKLAAKLAEVPLEEFVSLNPAHSRAVIRVDGVQTLLLPADKAATFQANLENNHQPLVSWQAYKLKSGDSLARVALRHGISVARLKQINGMTQQRRANPGSTLLVPAAGSVTPHLPNLPAPQVATAKAPKKFGKYAQRPRKGNTLKTAQKSKGKTVKAVLVVRKKASKKTATTARKNLTQNANKIVLAQTPRRTAQP